MGLAETAQLAVELNLGGNFNSGMATAEGKLAAFDAAAAGSSGKASALSGAFAKAGATAGKFGGALSHAGNQVKGLLSGPLGLLGLGAGVFAVGGALNNGIAKAQTWGLQIEKLQGITHNSAEELSGLLAVTEKYGLSNERLAQIAGFTEKALGGIALKAKGAADFQKNYGFAIEDSTGKVKDFNTILLQFSDYWNGNAAASTKAAAAAKIFGRGYADLVPILNLGSKGIRAAEEEAKALGLTLSRDNVADLAKMREATRQLGDAMGGLELQIGLALIPAISKFALAASKFIGDHRTDIVAFFRNAADAGEKVAGTIGDVVGALNRAWSAIPPELRDFIIKGVVADRTVKFLFGFSPIGALVSGIEGALGKAVGSGLVSAGLGKLFVQPVWVTNPGFGGGGGLPNVLPGVGAGAAAEGAATLGIGTIFAGVIAGAAVASVALLGLAKVVELTSTKEQLANATRDFNADQQAKRNPTGIGAGSNLAQNIADQRAHFDDLQNGLETAAGAAKRLAEQHNHYAEEMAGFSTKLSRGDWIAKIVSTWQKLGASMHDKIVSAMADLASGKNVKGAATFLGSKLGNAGFGAGGLAQANAVLALLKGLPTSPEVRAATRAIEGRLARLKTNKADLEAALKEANSTDPKNVKLDRLAKIAHDAAIHGDKTTHTKIENLITGVRHSTDATKHNTTSAERHTAALQRALAAKLAAANAKLQVLADKRETHNIMVRNIIPINVSVRDVGYSTTAYSSKNFNRTYS